MKFSYRQILASAAGAVLAAIILSVLRGRGDHRRGGHRLRRRHHGIGTRLPVDRSDEQGRQAGRRPGARELVAPPSWGDQRGRRHRVDARRFLGADRRDDDECGRVNGRDERGGVLRPRADPADGDHVGTGRTGGAAGRESAAFGRSGASRRIRARRPQLADVGARGPRGLSYHAALRHGRRARSRQATGGYFWQGWRGNHGGEDLREPDHDTPAPYVHDDLHHDVDLVDDLDIYHHPQFEHHDLGRREHHIDDRRRLHQHDKIPLRHDHDHGSAHEVAVTPAWLAPAVAGVRPDGTPVCLSLG